MALTVGGLFSGVGGLEWGLQRAGLVPRWHVEIEPYAKSILERRWPDAKIYGDITQVDWSIVESVDVVCGGFPCFPAGTLILTRRGMIDITAVVAGDEVWTHRNRWRTVIRHHGSHVAETIRLQGHGRPDLITTRNHPIWSVDEASAVPGWMDAEKMEGRFWASPIDMNCILPRALSGSHYAFVKDGHAFGKVRSVEQTGEAQEVFNFEVEEDNSYVADGLCVRNCQDISSTGRRAGILAGGKSGLWREFARCLSIVRPRYAVIENVAGLLSGGEAVPTCHCGATGRDFLADDADLLRVVDVEANNSREYLEDAYVARRDQTEPPEECYVKHARIGAVCVSCGRPVDDGTEKPVYQSWMGRVLGDLAALGYDAEWECLPAAAFGAPHLRYRTFIVAYADGK